MARASCPAWYDLRAVDSLQAWVADPRVWTALGVVSIVFFVGTLVAIPWVVARLPVDHFAPDRAPRPPRGFIVRLARNLLGVALIAAGVAMLVLPGQGILTLVMGLALTDFPGKRRAELRLVRRPSVRASLQWLRKRRGTPPLRFEVVS